jgi:hypothetical protein
MLFLGTLEMQLRKWRFNSTHSSPRYHTEVRVKLNDPMPRHFTLGKAPKLSMEEEAGWALD